MSITFFKINDLFYFFHAVSNNGAYHFRYKSFLDAKLFPQLRRYVPTVTLVELCVRVCVEGGGSMMGTAKHIVLNMCCGLLNAILYGNSYTVSKYVIRISIFITNLSINCS